MSIYQGFSRLDFPKIRNIPVADMGLRLWDIESHAPSGHPYKDPDKITWAHETTHYLNSVLRNRSSNSSNSRRYVPIVSPFRVGMPKVLICAAASTSNGFYIGGDQAVILEEPKGTISAVADAVPAALRGDIFKLYMVDQQQYWNDQPLYMIDEAMCYLNGSFVRDDLRITERSETITYALEMCTYAAHMQHTMEVSDEVKGFLSWIIRQTVMLATADGRSFPYMEKMKTHATEELKSIMGPAYESTFAGGYSLL